MNYADLSQLPLRHEGSLGKAAPLRGTWLPLSTLCAPGAAYVQQPGRGTSLDSRSRRNTPVQQQGVSKRAACRIIGVDVRTGKKWRNGRHGYGNRKALPPLNVVAASGGLSRYLREEDRIHIADRLREKAAVRVIAAELGCPSTVSREIRRNRHPAIGQYGPHTAQACADARRPRPKPGKIGRSPQLRNFIQDHLNLRWDPEQICQASADTVPRPAGDARGPRDPLPGPLRPRARRTAPRAGPCPAHRPCPAQAPAPALPARFVPSMVMISERPAEGRGPGGPRALGRRPHHRQEQQVCHRHSGWARHALRPAAPAR